MNTTKRQLPDMLPAIARFRDIAAQSGDALLTEGAVSPDHKLLDLCATALHHLVAAERARDARDKWWISLEGQARKDALAEDGRLIAEMLERSRQAKPYLPNITKLKATTAAGIYAKAMVVRASKTGAAGLAMSLAQDLLDCPGLRSSLWPAEMEGGR
jgi:hypothetical protein